MYCSNCGKLIKGNFCVSCGTKRGEEEVTKDTKINETVNETQNTKEDKPKSEEQKTHKPTKSTSKRILVDEDYSIAKELFGEDKDAKETKIEVPVHELNLDMSLEERTEKYIAEYMGKNIKMTPSEYFARKKPLSNMRTIIYILPMIYFFIQYGPIGVLGCLLFCTPPYVLLLVIRRSSENDKVTKCKYVENIGEIVYDDVRKNNKCSEIELDAYGENWFDIIFNKETYHRVLFNYRTATYTITTKGCTAKRALKSASANPVNITYKNSKLVNPVLKALVDNAMISV